MLGWNVSVYRQTNGGALPAVASSATGTRLAVWQCGVGSLDWLNELVLAEQALGLGGDGYPLRFTVQAEHLLSRVVKGPPGAHKVWGYDAGDIITEHWAGKTVIDRVASGDCRSDEWLLVEAWDES